MWENRFYSEYVGLRSEWIGNHLCIEYNVTQERMVELMFVTCGISKKGHAEING